jgi:hypothetical protein
MSSGLVEASRGLGLAVGEECSVDDVGEASLQRAASLGGCVVECGDASFEIGDRLRVTAGLGQRDAVERRVELAVPGAGEAMAFPVAGPDGERRGAVVAGERVLGFEASDVGDFADDLWPR